MDCGASEMSANTNECPSQVPPEPLVMSSNVLPDQQTKDIQFTSCMLFSFANVFLLYF